MLNKEQLITNLIQLFSQLSQEGRPASEIRQEVATGIANAIDSYIKDATVTGVCPGGSGGPLTNGQII